MGGTREQGHLGQATCNGATGDGYRRQRTSTASRGRRVHQRQRYLQCGLQRLLHCASKMEPQAACSRGESWRQLQALIEPAIDGRWNAGAEGGPCAVLASNQFETLATRGSVVLIVQLKCHIIRDFFFHVIYESLYHADTVSGFLSMAAPCCKVRHTSKGCYRLCNAAIRPSR